MKNIALPFVATLIFSIGPVMAEPPASLSAPAPADTAFDQLVTLAGTWRVADKPDSPLRIRFSLTAGGTLLIESWERGDKPHSLTLYHRDGARLVATHYCPQGNQPRLFLTSKVSDSALSFVFHSASDLDADESYLHDLSFNLTDRDRIIRSEIYRRGDDVAPSSLMLVRAGP